MPGSGCGCCKIKTASLSPIATAPASSKKPRCPPAVQRHARGVLFQAQNGTVQFVARRLRHRIPQVPSAVPAVDSRPSWVRRNACPCVNFSVLHIPTVPEDAVHRKLWCCAFNHILQGVVVREYQIRSHKKTGDATTGNFHPAHSVTDSLETSQKRGYQRGGPVVTCREEWSLMSSSTSSRSRMTRRPTR